MPARSKSSFRSPSRPPGLGFPSTNGFARRDADAASSSRHTASSATTSAYTSRSTSPSSLGTSLLDTSDIVCTTEREPTLWGDEDEDTPQSASDTPDPSTPRVLSPPPGLALPPHMDPDFRHQDQSPPRKKFKARPCCVVKLLDLPRYATKDDVKLGVADALHSDRFASEEERAKRSRKTTGLVNFEVLMETRYSSAQNMGVAFVLVPYGYHGWRLQEYGVTVKGVKLRTRPITDHEPTPSKRLLLQKTPYQDPGALNALNEKKRMLSGDIRLQGIELGTLQKDPRRVFSAEWSQDFSQRPCLLSFDDNLTSFRISYGGHADQHTLSIVVRFTTVKTFFYGFDFGRCYIVFHLSTSPAFEKGLNVTRAEDTPKRDLENIRQRLPYLDDSHRLSAPYAFQLRIEPLEESGLQEFLNKRVVASLPHGEDHRPSPGKPPPKSPLYFERRNSYGPIVMDRLLQWLSTLPFEIAFQVEALVRNGAVDPATILNLRSDLGKVMRPAYSLGVQSDIIRQLGEFIRKEVPEGVLLSNVTSLRALLDKAIKETERVTARAAAKKAEALAKKAKGKSLLPEEGLLPQVNDASAFLCYHVAITPTGIRLEGPFPVLSNRVLRRYNEHQHCFCRVHFTDEEQHQFRWEREVDGHEFVRQHVGGFLKSGFDLAGRHFDFLAYSFGALKEHTVWFVTPFRWHVTENGQPRFDARGRPITQLVDAHSIRASLGDFSKVIRCPSQYGARLSQAFSATYPSISVTADEVQGIVDIFDQQDGVRLMSDGCAPCSMQLAEEINDKLTQGRGRHDGLPPPHAFQMRIGGSKGMIYVNPELQGRVLCLRPSMNKFDAPDSLDVEISNVPRASAMYLNRPLVMVLEDLGVRFSTFLRLQQDAMDGTLSAARSIERFSIILSQLKLGARFSVHYVLGNLKDMGFGFEDDCAPDGSDDMGVLLGDYFFGDLRRSVVWDDFRKIKYQARIRVPDSWTLVGVLDEHKVLQHGEVMAYIQDSAHQHGYFLKGKILICRSPVVHPGDVQMVTAVVPPIGSALDKERLANCVVFSALGARSIPSALGGGDLDGDLFHVSEYEGIHVKNPYRPAEYAPGEKRFLDHDSSIDDIADFVVEYINSDVLGLVSTTHLIIADQHPDGVRAAKCMKLAELHSNAVDYAKTGIPVPQLRIPHFEFPAKPDWKADEIGDPGSAEFYQSQRALGHLFRRVQLTAMDPTVRVTSESGDGPVDDIEKLPQPTKTSQQVDDSITLALRDRIDPYLEELPANLPDLDEPMANIFVQYVYELRRICTLHALHIKSPLTEMEVMLGTILRKTAQPKRRKELAGRMHIHTAQLVGAVMGQLRPTGDEGDDVLALYKSWQAWLYVSRLPEEQIRGRLEKPFGAKSFGMIALAAIFRTLDSLDMRPPGMEEGIIDTIEDFEME